MDWTIRRCQVEGTRSDGPAMSGRIDPMRQVQGKKDKSTAERKSLRGRHLTRSFGSTVGQFVLLAGLRAQVAPGRDGEFKDVSTKR